MALAGISLAVVQFLLVQRMVKHYGEKRVCITQPDRAGIG